jgi:uncharacterized membrane protein
MNFSFLREPWGKILSVVGAVLIGVIGNFAYERLKEALAPNAAAPLRLRSRSNPA